MAFTHETLKDYCRVYAEHNNLIIERFDAGIGEAIAITERPKGMIKCWGCKGNRFTVQYFKLEDTKIYEST